WRRCRCRLILRHRGRSQRTAENAYEDGPSSPHDVPPFEKTRSLRGSWRVLDADPRILTINFRRQPLTGCANTAHCVQSGAGGSYLLRSSFLICVSTAERIAPLGASTR